MRAHDSIPVQLLAALVLPALAFAQTSSPTLTPTQRARVEYLLETRLPCRGCHVIAGRGGRIGPRLDGVAQRRPAPYIRNIIAAPQSTAPGTPMPRVPLQPRLLDRITAYLTALPPAADGAVPAARRLRFSTTAELYAHYCAACHGDKGKADGANARFLPVAPANHADGKAMGARTDDRLFDGIAAGGVALGRSPYMPAFGATLSAAQIRALVGHIRKLCKCRQPDWAE